MSERVERCRFAAPDQNGAHDFTDSWAPDGRPEMLYCRRCGEVILRDPQSIVVPPPESAK